MFFECVVVGLLVCTLWVIIIVHKNRLRTVHPFARFLIDLVFREQPVSVTLIPRKPSTEVKGIQTIYHYRWNVVDPREAPFPEVAGVFTPIETAESHRYFWLRERREDKGFPTIYRERTIFF